MSHARKRVLFVCMGNICRSPIAEGVARTLFARRAPELAIEFDSAGTHGYHVGEPPDSRAVDAARERGVDISGLRARRVRREDFATFDLIIAMDRDNLARLEELRPVGSRAQLRLMLAGEPAVAIDEVPDPYYGSMADFERVLDLLEAATEGLLRELTQPT